MLLESTANAGFEGQEQVRVAAEGQVRLRKACYPQDPKSAEGER